MAHEYTEHKKLLKNETKIKNVIEFIEWFMVFGFWIGKLGENGKFIKIKKTPKQWAADFVGIDMNKLEAEIKEMDEDFPKIRGAGCPNCKGDLVTYDLDVGKGLRCNKCYLYFENGKWWSVSCDEAHAHGKQCLREERFDEGST